MNDDLMVDLDQLLKEEMHPVYWIVDEIDPDGDALIFTNLNLLKAEKAIEEMGALDQKDRLETICVDNEADDRITPDILQKIILKEKQADAYDERFTWTMSDDERKSCL